MTDLNIVNIPSVADAEVEVDLSASVNWASPREIQGELISVNVSGGEVATRDLSALNGDVYTKGGKTAAHDVTLEGIFTDGEVADLHPLLEAKKGETIGLRWTPKGTGGTRRFTIAGTLYKIDPPSLSGDGDVTYGWGVRGQISGGATS